MLTNFIKKINVIFITNNLVVSENCVNTHTHTHSYLQLVIRATRVIYTPFCKSARDLRSFLQAFLFSQCVYCQPLN